MKRTTMGWIAFGILAVSSAIVHLIFWWGLSTEYREVDFGHVTAEIKVKQPTYHVCNAELKDGTRCKYMVDDSIGVRQKCRLDRDIGDGFVEYPKR